MDGSPEADRPGTPYLPDSSSTETTPDKSFLRLFKNQSISPRSPEDEAVSEADKAKKDVLETLKDLKPTPSFEDATRSRSLDECMRTALAQFGYNSGPGRAHTNIEKATHSQYLMHLTRNFQHVSDPLFRVLDRYRQDKTFPASASGVRLEEHEREDVQALGKKAIEAQTDINEAKDNKAVQIILGHYKTCVKAHVKCIEELLVGETGSSDAQVIAHLCMAVNIAYSPGKKDFSEHIREAMDAAKADAPEPF